MKPKKLGRPVKATEVHITIPVWAPVSEKKLITKEAEKAGKSVSGYLLDLAREKRNG